jgi:hypothetical protein
MREQFKWLQLPADIFETTTPKPALFLLLFCDLFK